MARRDRGRAGEGRECEGPQHKGYRIHIIIISYCCDVISVSTVPSKDKFVHVTIKLSVF